MQTDYLISCLCHFSLLRIFLKNEYSYLNRYLEQTIRGGILYSIGIQGVVDLLHFWLANYDVRFPSNFHAFAENEANSSDDL